MSTRTASLMGVVLGLSLAVLGFGCGGEGETGTTVPNQEGTAGGENSGLQAPPGSQDADTDDWDGDGDQPPPAAQGGESPWGSPLSEQGRPLPTRRPLDGGAANSLRQGFAAADQGDVASARRAFESALASDGQSYEALFALGVLADRAGETSRAMEFYRRSLSAQADYEKAAEGIVNLHVRQSRPAEAVRFVEPLAQAWVRNLHLQALLAEALVHANRPDDAVAAARVALRRDERFVPAMVAIVKASLSQGRNELAEAVIGQALAIDDENADLHFLKGRMLLEEDGRLREALTELRRAVELRPAFAAARTALGVQLLNGANYEEALTQLQAVVRLAPTAVEAHLNVGDAYRANARWEPAKQAFDRALQMESNLPEAHFNLGLLYMTALDEFPGLSRLQALQKSAEEFTRYRDMMGSRLARKDPSEGYLEDLNRQIDREQRRIERDRARAQRAAERAARAAGGE